ncbi:MAG: hypothetical protein ACKVQU_37045 [Burkholderiales bacterium]
MGQASLIRLGAALVAVIAIAACRSGPDQAPPASSQVPASTQPLYLCCNVRTETDWLSDGGFLVGRVIPAGTPVKLLGSSRGVANVEIDGKRFRLSNEFGARAEPIDQWLKKVLVAEDPTALVKTFSLPVQSAIASGKIARGMTKDQVVITLGHPPAHANANLGAADWTYMYNRWGPLHRDVRPEWPRSGRERDRRLAGHRADAMS